MTTHQRWGLTAALLLWAAIIIFCISAITGIWNGWALLGVFMVFGFAWITIRKD
jgi:hypothetical protein